MNYATPHSLQVDSRLSGKIPASESFRVGPLHGPIVQALALAIIRVAITHQFDLF